MENGPTRSHEGGQALHQEGWPLADRSSVWFNTTQQMHFRNAHARAPQDVGQQGVGKSEYHDVMYLSIDNCIGEMLRSGG